MRIVVDSREHRVDGGVRVSSFVEVNTTPVITRPAPVGRFRAGPWLPCSSCTRDTRATIDGEPLCFSCANDPKHRG